MKKIICSTLVILSFAGSAFAVELPTTSPTSTSGMTIRGGADSTTAGNAPTPLIKFSTGVFGMVNFTAAANLSSGYLIATRHLQGSKYFSTTNTKTNIYWKQAPKVADAAALRTAMATDIGSNITTATQDNTYAAGNGWTSY